MTCSTCARTSKTDRLPHGWKRHQESVYCEHCWRERYILRSIAMPVVEPVAEAWSDLREALKEAWVQTTTAANWMMTELYARDVRRNGEEKMPPMKRVYLYPEARLRFPGLAPQSVVSLENSVQAAYRAARYEVLWTCSASLPTYRYPRPLPVHNQSWEATIAEERPVVRVRLGNQWWHLRLKGGPRFRPQTDAYRQMVSGVAVRGELTLYRVRAHDGKLSGRPNDDQKVKYTVMCKMVAWLPRPAARELRPLTDTLRVETANDMLLVALNSRKEPIWRYHGDHLRRWAAEHRRSLQNLADDQKAEQHPTPAFADRRTASRLKYRNRVQTVIREIAAQLISYTLRRDFSVISYDDTATGFCPDFPYAALRDQLRNKCGEAGLAFEYSRTALAPEPVVPVERSASGRMLLSGHR